MMSSRTRTRYGVRTRLRDDACDRERSACPAKRARMAVRDAQADERRVLDAAFVVRWFMCRFDLTD